MRYEFGRTITELAERDKEIYLIVGDIGYGTFDDYRARFPDRFINIGIREQSMIGIASGMALEGLKPWVYTITPFLIERPFEQIKIDIDQQNVNVKLVGYADYPLLGPTHAEIIAPYFDKLFPNINAYFPRNSVETREMTLLSYKLEGPVFVSLKKDKG